MSIKKYLYSHFIYKPEVSRPLLYCPQVPRENHLYEGLEDSEFFVSAIRLRTWVLWLRLVQSISVQPANSHVHSSPSATLAELFKHNFLTDITTHHYGFRHKTPEIQGIHSQPLFQQQEGQSRIPGSVLTRLSLRNVPLMSNSDDHDDSPTTLPATASSDLVVDAASASAITPRIVIPEASLQGQENLY
jgi:hypothetical protein